jgi:hypothetical protein
MTKRRPRSLFERLGELTFHRHRCAQLYRIRPGDEELHAAVRLLDKEIRETVRQLDKRLVR